jgi:hypothetical protein
MPWLPGSNKLQYLVGLVYVLEIHYFLSFYFCNCFSAFFQAFLYQDMEVIVMVYLNICIVISKISTFLGISLSEMWKYTIFAFYCHFKNSLVSVSRAFFVFVIKAMVND